MGLFGPEMCTERRSPCRWSRPWRRASPPPHRCCSPPRSCSPPHWRTPAAGLWKREAGGTSGRGQTSGGSGGGGGRPTQPAGRFRGVEHTERARTVRWRAGRAPMHCSQGARGHAGAPAAPLRLCTAAYCCAPLPQMHALRRGARRAGGRPAARSCRPPGAPPARSHLRLRRLLLLRGLGLLGGLRLLGGLHALGCGLRHGGEVWKGVWGSAWAETRAGRGRCRLHACTKGQPPRRCAALLCMCSLCSRAARSVRRLEGRKALASV